jgi:hypothetical protein
MQTWKRKQSEKIGKKRKKQCGQTSLSPMSQWKGEWRYVISHMYACNEHLYAYISHLYMHTFLTCMRTFHTFLHTYHTLIHTFHTYIRCLYTGSIYLRMGGHIRLPCLQLPTCWHLRHVQTRNPKTLQNPTTSQNPRTLNPQKTI